jgi:hypothetical protein
MRFMNSTWQPIETAPVDGTRVLLFTPGRGVDVGYWYQPDRLWDRDWSSKKMARAEPPSHWMPLPAEPEVVA